MRAGAYLVAVTALVLLSATSAEAAGRRVLNNYPVSTTNGVTRVPVAITDAQVIYPVLKMFPQARVATLARDIVASGGVTLAAYLLLDQMLDNSFQFQNGQIVKGTPYYPGSWGFSGATWPAQCSGTTPEAVVDADCLSAIGASNPSRAPYSGGQSFVCTSPRGNGNCNAGYVMISCKAGQSCAPWNGNPAQAALTNGDPYGPGSTNYAPATDAQIAQAVQSYSQPYNQRDFWEPWPGASDVAVERFDSTPHEPLKLTQQQLDDLNNQLKTSCNPAGDLLVYELCVIGREHGVTASPPSTDVPEATQGEPTPETPPQVNVTVNVPADQPGGAFEAAELAELDTFGEVTQAFTARLQAAPIIAALDDVAASVPAGVCPNATISLFGVELDFMELACPVWETSIAPLLAVIFGLVWSFTALRILLSA